MKKRLITMLLAVITVMSLTVTTASADKLLGAKTSTALNLRSGAGTGYSILMTMPKDTQLLVLSSSDGWCKVMYDNTIAYASGKYLLSCSKVSGSFGTGTISGSDVRMRKGAGTGYAILGTYDKGTQMTVTGASGNWYAVSYKGTSGYVSADYMSISVTPKATSYPGAITGTSVRMRSGAGTSYSTLGYYSNGTTMSVTGSENGWYKVSLNGKNGFVSGMYMKITPKTAYKTDKMGTVSGTVNQRMGPSTAFSSISKLPKGTDLRISGEYGSWYEVTANDKYGYVSKSYVKLVDNSIPAPDEKLDKTGTVTGNEVRMRKGPGTGYDIITYLNSGERVDIFGKTGNWYAVSYDGKKGYMSADYVKIKSNEEDTGFGAEIVAKAKTYLGTPYVYGGSSPSGFDCSGFVYYLYGQYGYSLKRGAGGQYNNNGTSVEKSKLKQGDLVFFSDDVDPIGHVGMYIGDGQFIHASSGRGCVCVSNLSDYYYNEHYTGAKRIVE